MPQVLCFNMRENLIRSVFHMWRKTNMKEEERRETQGDMRD